MDTASVRWLSLLLLGTLALDRCSALVVLPSKQQSLARQNRGTSIFRLFHGREQHNAVREDDLDSSSFPNQPTKQTGTTTTTRRSMLAKVAVVTASSSAIMTAVVAAPGVVPSAEARPESVNRPDLLPKEPGANVIQIEKFLTSGQAKRMDQLLAALERDTGYRVRVLCQAYPYTPGLAIRDYWDLGKEDQKDDKYVVLVADQFGGKGNVLNFNVGDGVKLVLPNIFWTRLANAYGTIFYVRENGVDMAIINAIESIVSCLRSEEQFCVNIPDTAPSMRSLGMS
ncbi:hypothetical protein ACA910_016831 [Epithemia clementina (nom. ined.)]